MRRGFAAGLIGCCAFGAACGAELTGSRPGEADAPPADPDAGIPGDAPPDAVVLGPWGAPALVSGASSAALGEDDGSLSSNTRELVFAIAGTNGKDLFYMSRAAGGAFSAPARLPFNQTDVSDETPRFSADDLTLYFASARAGGPGGLDIYRVTRPSIGAAWGTPALVPGVSTTGVDKWFTPCAVDNTYLTVLGTDIGFGTIGNAPQIETTLSSAGTEIAPFLSPDCLTAYLSSTRNGTNQIFVATRATRTSPWSMPKLVDDFKNLGNGEGQEDPWVSSDLRTFLFVSNAGGSKDLYISTR